jgi:hypothetical protein
MQDLGLLRQWEDPLLQMGIPAYYASPAEAAARSDVVALDGYTAWCPSDGELERILHGRVLLDGDAGWAVQERGFGRLLGVRVGAPAGHGVHAEAFAGGILPGVDAIRVPNRNRAWRDIQPAGASVVSELIDPRNRRHVGSAVFENEPGGRVAVCACVGDTEGTLASHARRRWLHGLLRWLSRDRFCALPVIPHHGLTVVRRRGEETLLAVANLGTDPLETLEVRLPSVPATLAVLDRGGAWRPAPVRAQREGVAVVCAISCRLEGFDWVVVRLAIGR